MKKILFAATTALLISTGIQAQKSLYDGIESYQGKEFEEYYSVSKVEGKDGFYKLSTGRDYKYKLDVQRLPSGSPFGIMQERVGTKEQLANQMTSGDEVDNYSSTAMVRNKKNERGYIFIDNMLIDLEGVSEDGMSYTGIDVIYVLTVEVDPNAPKKKVKLTFKQKMELVKQAAQGKQMEAPGTEACQKVMNTNLDSLITNYLKAMKKKQASSSSATESKLAKELKDAKNKDAAETAAEWDAYWKSPAGQAKKARYAKTAAGGDAPTRVTIKNTGGKNLHIQHSGGSFTITPGSSSKVKCDRNIYYGIGEVFNKQGAMIYTKDSKCGGTVEVVGTSAK